MKPSERIKEIAINDFNKRLIKKYASPDYISAILQYLDEQRELENQRMKDILQGKNL